VRIYSRVDQHGVYLVGVDDSGVLGMVLLRDLKSGKALC
jgi:hypothetical protein